MNVTAIIVNRKTLALTKKCLESLLEFYPDIKVVLIDNRSGKDHPSLHYVKSAAAEFTNVRCHLITSSVPHHAHGLNVGVSLVQTRYFLTLDSDVTVLRGGWIEKMLAAFKSDRRLFAIGSLGGAGKDCTAPQRKGEKKVAYVHPFCAMWDREKYVTLGRKFAQTGQPVCPVCIAATQKGFHLKGIKGINPHNKGTNLYVHHVWGGTRTVLAVLRERNRKLRRGKK